ncbi:HGxxPAAW family protein [Allosalinactinospora lopnorensis]|uniref:HGxxPAAW family protein n=1 Tax=Allosalinactinospora lopnorensis TaxID=1352348 RepID=UPI000623DB88|nr:HGxxPAAW family protein [Allosalinactinospora lopnorensis]
MADEHHEDHGNTVAAWFLTLSWIVVWSVAGVGIIFFGKDVVQWTVIGLVLSAVCAVIAGALKMAGFGRKEPRPSPLTAEEWAAQQEDAAEAETAAEAVKGGDDGDSGKEPATAGAK